MPRRPLRDGPPERWIALVATCAFQDILKRRVYFLSRLASDQHIRDAVSWELLRRRAFDLNDEERAAAAALVKTALALEDA